MAVLHVRCVIQEASRPCAVQRNAKLAVLDASLLVRPSSHVNFVPKDTSPIMHPPNFAHPAVLDRMQVHRERLSVLHARAAGSLLELGQWHVILVGQDGIRWMVQQRAYNVPQDLFLLSRIHQRAIRVHMAVGSPLWGAQLVTIVQLDFHLLKEVERPQTVQSALPATAMHYQGRRALNVKQAPLPTTLALHDAISVQLVDSRGSLVLQCAKIVHKELLLSRWEHPHATQRPRQPAIALQRQIRALQRPLRRQRVTQLALPLLPQRTRAPQQGP
jgi:hypothetical protein